MYVYKDVRNNGITVELHRYFLVYTLSDTTKTQTIPLYTGKQRFR